MHTTGLQRALDHLRLADGGLSDVQLLTRFLEGRDEAAFAALVRRHGAMVLGVCKRVLGHAQDAEDAFQATFLVLARKAAAAARGQVVASFLYGVAYRTALCGRAKALRRRATERQVQTMPHPEVLPPEAQDWRPLLDRELSRLPEKYRAAIVLCDLEGKTRREAARQLKLPEGTLSTRLATGRQMLARRLTQAGLVLSGGALAAAVAEGASAAVPAPWVNATARAAVLVVAGKSAAVATPAALLMNEVLGAMLMSKLKTYVAVALVAVALGIGGLAYRAAGQGTSRPEARPLTDVEVLQREVAILRAQMALLQDQVRGQQAELRALKRPGTAPSLPRAPGSNAPPAMERPLPQRAGPGPEKLPPPGLQQPTAGVPLPELPPVPAAREKKPAPEVPLREPAVREKKPPVFQQPTTRGRQPEVPSRGSAAPHDTEPLRQIEAAVRQLRAAQDEAARQRAADALEQAVRSLHARPDQPANRVGQ
jgi:RNA polymerase sigma factor (sigma-70 family)